MKHTLKLACACAVLFTLPLQSPAGAQDRAFEVRRAINFAQRFTWPRYEASGSGIQWPPYQDTAGPSDTATFAGLREAGFDAVRLPVDPAPFIVFTGEKRQQIYGMLFDTIDRLNGAGLKVILDIHPNSKHVVWGQHAVVAGVEAAAFGAVMDVAEEMARRLRPYTANVALELLNEPRLKCTGAEQQLWQTMAEHLASRTRAANPKLTLVVTGACVSAPEGLLALDPKTLGGANTIYTFHYYEPFSFTHQGAQFIAWPDKYLDGVPWPASARPITEPQALLELQINASLSNVNAIERVATHMKAKHNLDRYYRKKPDVSLIETRFREIAAWAQKHGIPPQNIFLGEFGVVRREPGKPGAFCDDRARWHRDVRVTAETFGFSWAYFNFNGPFGLVSDDKKQGAEFDPVTLAALGLKSPCPSMRFLDRPGDSAGAHSCAQRCLDSANSLDARWR